MSATYRGWFGVTARRRCPHSDLEPIYGDEILRVGGWRLRCRDCRRFIDGPVRLAELRRTEATP